jgi:hypothetical protein
LMFAFLGWLLPKCTPLFKQRKTTTLILSQGVRLLLKPLSNNGVELGDSLDHKLR